MLGLWTGRARVRERVVSNRPRNFRMFVNPAQGFIRVDLPYNGARHNDLRVTTEENGMTVERFEDGELVAIELRHAGAGLDLEVWPGKA